MADICTSNDSRNAALHVFIGGGPGGDADPHSTVTLPDSSTAPASAFILDASQLLFIHSDQDLIDDHLIEDGESCCGETFRKPARMAARSFDKIGKSIPAKRSQR